jgi:hypothetical protein
MPKRNKDAGSVEFPQDARKRSPEERERRCPHCDGEMIRGEFSSVANFGVTKEPHFVATYGWMQVKYDRASPIDTYMCLKCGYIEFYARTPLAVLDPMKRQEYIKDQFPELKKKLEREESKRREQESMETLPEGDDHTGI